MAKKITDRKKAEMILLMDMALFVFTMVMGMHEVLIGLAAAARVSSGLKVGGKGKKDV